MNILDNVISAFSPSAGLKRAQARRVLALYEAAEPSRLRKTKPDNRSGDALTARAGNRIRGYARNQEQNYDFAEAVLGALVDNVIGPDGINIEPLPKDKDGNLLEDLAHQISELRKDWMKKPEVTWEHTWPAAERLIARAWFRDGECLLQHVEGLSPSISHGTRIPYSVEMIEADLLPFNLDDKNKGITQGVERNAWGRPTAYHIYKEHPGDVNYLTLSLQTKRVPAEKMLHPKIVKRFKQARGVSVFASMMTRIEDIKDYEESERVAARIAAAMCAYIQKGTPEDYEKSDDDGNRDFKVKPGTIFDNLGPGETVGTIDSNRPSALLEPFRDAMVRMAVSSVRAVTFSGVAKKYDGTYSAQRQELVEGYISNKSLSNLFASQVSIPVYQRMLAMAVLSGQIKLPAELDMATLYDVDARGPVMPWIDPEKEEKALERAERAGHKSAQQSIRERGGNPKQVMAEIETWRKQADEKGLVFSTDPKYDKSVPDLIFEDVGNNN
jgi:lambda family phage portal protein